MRCWGIFLLGLGSLELCAQELVTAHHSYTPNGVTALLHRGFRSADDERAWVVVLALSLPLVQLRDSLWLVGIASHLLQANSLNDIGFNPRGARWEEQLVLLWQRSRWKFYGGLLHFCKHEIDNADPPDTDEPVAGYQPTKRVLILHGPFAGAQYRSGWGRGWRAVLEGRVYGFVIAQDYRVRGTDELRWQRLRGSLAVRASLVAHLGHLRSFGSVAYRLALFQAPVVVRHEYRGELGITLGALPIALFGYGEQLFDDLARPFPHPSRSFGFGLRWVGTE
ncbi:hypothetical protein HRbin21_00338 [bacterium HR21]|nr:hypothetical protein HRbin21_00338 [bacterium HR21]